MFRHLLKIYICILYLSLASSLFAQSSTIEYPNWFLFPTKFSSITTGFSSSDSSTLKSAAKRKAVLENCIAKGTLYLYEVTDDYDFNKDSDYYYYYSYQRAKEFEAEITSVNKYILNVLNDEYIEAFTTDTTNIDSVLNLKQNEIVKPNWTAGKSFYKQDGYYYSVGIYTSIGRDNDAWITSEEQAMFNLLRNVYIQVGGITKIVDSERDSEDSYEKVTAHKLNAKMSNIEVMERYPSREQKLYYTLIRVKEENVKIIDK